MTAQLSGSLRRTSRLQAFSLIELLVVMGVIVLIASLVVPSFSSIVVGTNLSRAGQIIGDELTLARQEAVTKNRDVIVRFYKWTEVGDSEWRGIQLLSEIKVGASTEVRPLGRLKTLPQGVVLDSDLSPILELPGETLENDVSPPDKEGLSVASFRFRANGTTQPQFANDANYVTVRNLTASGNPPDNYYTLQINPVTGKVSTYRP